MRRAVAWLWFALAAAWACVVVATDRPASMLALWIVVTIVPVTALDRAEACRRGTTPPLTTSR